MWQTEDSEAVENENTDETADDNVEAEDTDVTVSDDEAGAESIKRIFGDCINFVAVIYTNISSTI